MPSPYRNGTPHQRPAPLESAMAILFHGVMFLLAAALARAWPQPLRVGSVAPDLVLVLVACIGITRGRVAGYAAGLVGGLLTASTTQGPFGTILLSHMAVGFLAGQARGRVFVEHILAAPVVAVLATLLAGVIQLAVAPPPAFGPWLGQLAVGLLYNALISPISYTYARAVSQRWPARAEA